MEEFLQIIKDYGSAIISTVSAGGIAAVAGVIIKIKKSFDETKAKLNKKDELLAKSNSEVASVVEQNKQLLSKIDELTNDVYKLESKVNNVKGNRDN